MVLTKILEDLTSKLDKTEFLDTLTKTTNSALKEDGFQFSEQEVLKIVQKTLSNAVMSGNEENIKRTITLLVEEVIIHHSGTLELILVSTH
jgi:hypothetical protein